MKVRVGEKVKIYNETLLMNKCSYSNIMCKKLDCRDCILCFEYMCIPAGSTEIIFHTNIDISYKLKKVK